ncbi:hypothetical protein [Ekhidna sp.]|uniref:hypothetical protein n=1 Tax=Ekhidna sp. TaxID=2608089 RepID=UPI003CCC08D7
MATAKDQLKLIRLLHFALMGGAGLFAVMAAILIVSDEVSQPSIEVLDYLSPAYFFIMLATYPVVFKAALKKTALLEKTLSQKLASFQTAHIIRMAMLEGCALFASVAALINGELLHLIIASLTLAIMFSKTPTPFLLESELGLNQDEKDQLIVL